MQLYSVSPAARARQLAADVSAVLAIVLFVLLGVAAAAAVRTLASLGRGIENAGSGLRSTMADAATRLGDLPLIGSGASRPFSSASDAGSALASAGRDQQTLVGHAALVVGLLVALVPIVILLRVWLCRRIAFARRAASARSLSSSIGGTELLALRALATSKAALSVSADPVDGWRRGEPAIIRALADLALRDAGVAR